MKTQSPLSGCDEDSLTFFSLPQSEPPCDVADQTDMSDRIEAITQESLSTRTGQRKSTRAEKVADQSPTELSHGSIPDVAAMLPLSQDSEPRDAGFNDDDDEIAETLQRSLMTEGQDSTVHCFMLLDHNEQLQVRNIPLLFCTSDNYREWPCLSVSVCLSQVGVLSKGMNGLIWCLACGLLSTSLTLCFKEIRVSPKIRALPSGTLLQTLTLKILPRHIAKC